MWLLRLARLPLLGLLLVLEPFVRVALTATALITTAIAIFFECVTARPAFPFFGMLSFSIACVLLLKLYYLLLRLVL